MTEQEQAQGGLVLEGVHKSFGRSEVLRGIDLFVAEHEVVCLIGASGSGKSTLLRCINLIEPLDHQPPLGNHATSPPAWRLRRSRATSQSVKRASGIVTATNSTAAAR